MKKKNKKLTKLLKDINKELMIQVSLFKFDIKSN